MSFKNTLFSSRPRLSLSLFRPLEETSGVSGENGANNDDGADKSSSSSMSTPAAAAASGSARSSGIAEDDVARGGLPGTPGGKEREKKENEREMVISCFYFFQGFSTDVTTQNSIRTLTFALAPCLSLFRLSFKKDSVHGMKTDVTCF